MQDGVHSSTTGASAQRWWTPTPASLYSSVCGPPECNGGPAGGISCRKIVGLYNRVARATLVGQFQPNNAHLQVVILDNDWSLSRITTWAILERMQDGVHSSTTSASARSWWTPTPASWYSFCGPPECNGGPAGGVSCWKISDIYNRVALATLVGPF